MPKYSETHHLNIDDAGLASVHVAVHLQDADPRIARLLVLRVLDTASTITYLDPLILPQTSGPCVHYDEQAEYAADAYPCTYPYGDGTCPHLDNPEILCPVKDACAAMSEVARMREACEAEQEEQDADMAAQDAVYETETPEFVEPEPAEEQEFTVPHPTFRPGDRVRITHALHRGQTGEIQRYFPATENYLVAIDGMPDMIVLTDAQMEAV